MAPKRTPGLPSLHPPAPPPPNLPVQRTPLIGRAAEVAAVRELLGREGVGLVTLTGAGGSGKTRLGLQVASELLEQFSDGVFFVDLQPIRDAKLVVSAIAQTLAVRESPDHPLPESLKEHVRDKQLLLLVDNFEQVLSAAPHVAALLAAAPGLKVLVTSRAVLRVRGEHEFPVLPLAVPGVQAIGRSSVRAFGTGKVSDQPVFVDPERPNAWTPDRLIEYPAVELFVQRARVVRPDFALTEENAAAVAQICQRLDGLPLAMELAAARLKLLSPEALLARLDQRLKLLTGGARDAPARQQTLRDMIAWSYDLLSESEQRLLGRLSVFAGGASLEAVESVCMPFQGSVGLPGIDRDDWKSDTVAPLDRTAFPPAPSTELLDAITSLVDRSMVYLDETGVHGCRVCLLETIREFGLEQLALSREAEMAQRRHTEYFTALAEHLDTDSLERSEARRHEQMEREHDNFRAALAWCEDRGETLLGLRLAGTLGIFWMNHCYLSEGWGHLTRLLAQSEGQPPTLDRATALRSAGKLADAMGNAANAERLHQECLAIRQQLSDQWGVAAAWRNLGNAALDRGDPDTALTRYETAMAVCQQLGPLMQIAWMHHCLGRVLAIQGKYEHARTHLEACLAFFEGPSANPVHTHHGVGAHLDLALIDTAQGACASACRHLEQAMALLVAEGPRLSFPLAWMRCAGLAVAQGQAERAVRFLAAAKSLRGAIGAHLTFHQQQECDRTLSAARSALGEEAFAAAWATGQDMSLDEAIQYALVA